MSGGRPLRFLAGVLGGWAAIRVALLMPGAGPLPALIRDVMPHAAAAVLVAPVRRVLVQQDVPPASPPRLQSVGSSTGTPTDTQAEVIRAPRPPAPPTQPIPQRVATIPPPLPPTPRDVRRSRWSGSAWGLVRGGTGGTVSGGQLGASQAGIRILYALGESRRLAIAVRVAAPLRGRGREAAVGLDWRPTDLPFRLIAEQRFALDGGSGGPTIGVIGGYGPADIAPGILVEAYGQAGAIRRHRVETFVDASARVSHPVARIRQARLDIALGAWGSAQRAAERFDIGPSIGIAVPVADRALRLNLDWRHRIAGRARPGSGPALSIGSDF